MKRSSVFVVLFALLVSGLCMAACAALFNQSTEKVMISSEPDGADVFINGKRTGKTPMQVDLGVDSKHTIELRKQGFQATSTILQNHVGAGWIVLDILCGLVPIIIDAATDSWYELDDLEVAMVLTPGESAPPATLSPASAAGHDRDDEDVSVADHIKRQAENTVVAVFDIEDKSGQFSKNVLDQLTDYLAIQLTERAGYRVAPREELRKKLAADKKSSYEGRFDEAYQIELGKALSVQKTLVTRIMQVGSKCSLSATLFDLTTETTDKAASVDTACSIDALMVGARELATKLAIDR